MEKLVWCKVKQFLEVLRCEDIDRESRVDTKEFRMAKQNLCEKNTIYQQSINVLSENQQEKIRDYIETFIVFFISLYKFTQVLQTFILCGL